MRILMVCLGNICRSPTAEAALREALQQAGVTDVEIDSAGTGDWHVGAPPDTRMSAAAAATGLTLDGAARQVTAEDFADFDLIVAMDRSNRDDLWALAPDDEARAKVVLFRDFEDGAEAPDVPDPYFGGQAGFARVVDIARAGAKGLVRHILSRPA